jgi:hypothetical protein
MNYTLQDIKKSKNIILSNSRGLLNANYNIGVDILNNTQLITYYRKIFKKYIRFNEATREYLANEYNKILRDKQRVLGVLCRGTDYLVCKPALHPIQPEPEEVIKKAEIILCKYNCSYIYLATEDQYIYELFKSHFGTKLLTNKQTRFNQYDLVNNQRIADVYADRDQGKLGLEYLSSLNLLSKCTCFIGGQTFGTIGVYLMSEKFEYDYTWELGRYPNSHVSFFELIKRLIKTLF